MASNKSVVLNLGNNPLWVPYKSLYNILIKSTSEKAAELIPDLELALKNHIPDFICLLKNPARSAIHLEAVKKASTTGIAVAGQAALENLSQEIVDEALIISEMFNLNELTALELLISGLQQQPYFLGLTRGLVAVILYYDGRRNLVNSLRVLAQAQDGKSWTLDLSLELSSLITNYAKQLKDEGVIMTVIDLIENMDIAKEMEILQMNKALGGPRYRKQVSDLICEIKQSLAEIVLFWACQSTLTIDEVMRLMNYLSVYKVPEGSSVDNPTVTLTLAMLYVMDVSMLLLCDEMDASIMKLNLVRVPNLGVAIHRNLISDMQWQIPGLKSILQFAWGVTLSILSQHPTSPNSHLHPTIENLGTSLEEDDRMVTLGVEKGAFEAITNIIVENQMFHQEEFYLKRIHNLVADFITLMPDKLSKIRTSGEESAKMVAACMQEGIDPPPNLPMHFQHFLILLSKIYAGNPLGLNLALDYWCPSENLTGSFISQRQRQVSLFKFVRVSGNLLPPPLFLPYHRMLTSLSSSKLCAHHCYNLLKTNTKHGSYYSIVSWDHFFATLHNYFNNLREEVAITVDSHQIYRQRMLTKGITPQEVQGLSAVLDLISEIVKLDEIASMTLAENSEYTPCNVLIGLVTCSVPLVLKAALIRCIAAFAYSYHAAIGIWIGIEAAQVIPTLKSTNVYHPSGIQMEIEDVETRNEEYPVTIAILELLNSLIQHPIPIDIGSSHRVPGLQPYLDFVRDKVLLRWAARSYKSQKERWKILELCLNLLCKVLCDYKVSSADQSFVLQVSTDGVTAPVLNHPGHSILVEMFQDSGLLKILLFVLDEGIRILEMYKEFEGQTELERGTLLALEMLFNSLSKQDAFLQQVRDTNSHLLITTLDNLLMGINPRSGQADYVLIISKYIIFNTTVPQHTLLSLQILLVLVKSTQVAQHLLAIYETKEGDALLHGMVECLENGTYFVEETDEVQGSQDSRSKAQQLVLMFLLNCLQLSSPNISHYLLGFNTQRSIAQTEIQEPGVIGVVKSRRTCLHAVLSILEDWAQTADGFSGTYRAFPVISLAYQLIYSLCADKEASGPVLRYLRSTHDLFYRHLKILPFRVEEKQYADILSVQSWLLKCLAIELRVTSAHHQHSHVQRLLMSILDDKQPSLANSGDITSESILGLSNTILATSTTFNTGPTRRKLMCIFDSLDFEEDPPPSPKWQCFETEPLQNLLKDCEVHEVSGAAIISVKKLHQRLSEEIAVHRNASANDARATVLQDEVTLVLDYAQHFNEFSRKMFAVKQAFNAWRQVTEVLLLACPLHILGNEKKEQIILEISQELILKIKSSSFLHGLMAPASGIILTLMSTLRQSIKSSSYQSLSEPSSKNYSLYGIPNSSLLVVLQSIIECLKQNGSRVQAVRANFYSAMLNLLCIVDKSSDSTANKELSVLDNQAENRKLQREYMKIILNFGDSLTNIICRDVCTSHDITKMLSMAVLDLVIALDTQQTWLNYLVSKGYLRHILDSLSKDDEQLQDLLSQTSNNYRTFYVFESKMSLLARIGSSVAGALALLQHGAIGKLAECGSINIRPDMYLSEDQRRNSENWILPDLIKCHQHIIKAVMKLMLSITMTLQPYHKDSSLQLIEYIAYNAEFFFAILRDCSNFDNENRLEELSLITAVLCRIPQNDSAEHKSQILLLRQHLIVLLQCILVPDDVRHNRMSMSFTAENVVAMKVSRLQIAAHILGMCCDTVDTSDLTKSSSSIIFGPFLTSTATSYHFGRTGMSVPPVPVLNKPPDLSLIVAILHQCCSQLQSCLDDRKALLAKLQSLPTLTQEEIAEYLPDTKVRYTPQHQQELAQKCLRNLLELADKQKAILSYMIETSAFILLKHLEYYSQSLKRKEFPSFSSQPVSKESFGIGDNPVLSAQEYEHFKDQVSMVLSESFFRQLMLIQEHLSKDRSHVSFLEAIVNRIKRLVRFKT